MFLKFKADIKYKLLGEGISISMWGNLGRLRSRGPQMALATYHLLMNTTFLVLAVWETGGLGNLSDWSLSDLGDSFSHQCNLIILSGLVSYFLSLYLVFT